jgi:adenosylcobinamide kinase/adenosylcobinamide-phosphate guanylyltransferase
VPELNRRLEEWGAEVLCDGALLVTDSVGPELTPAPERRTARRALITGGARSGKSVEAERRVAAAASMTYVATSAPRLTESGAGDPEWERRIDLHRTRRPAHWETVEIGTAPDQLAELMTSDRPAILVDCLTLWLTAVIDSTDLWALSPRDEGYESAMAQVFSQIDRLCAAVSSARGQRVLVTNEVGSGVVPATPSGRLFQDLLGSLNARMAAVCDEVDLVVAGQVLPLRASAASSVSVVHSCG